MYQWREKKKKNLSRGEKATRLVPDVSRRPPLRLFLLQRRAVTSVHHDAKRRGVRHGLSVAQSLEGLDMLSHGDVAVAEAVLNLGAIGHHLRVGGGVFDLYHTPKTKKEKKEGHRDGSS